MNECVRHARNSIWIIRSRDFAIQLDYWWMATCGIAWGQLRYDTELRTCWDRWTRSCNFFVKQFKPFQASATEWTQFQFWCQFLILKIISEWHNSFWESAMMIAFASQSHSQFLKVQRELHRKITYSPVERREIHSQAVERATARFRNGCTGANPIWALFSWGLEQLSVDKSVAQSKFIR